MPLIMTFGVWRHVVHRDPVRFEAGLWSIIFPFGMYSVASMHFGEVAHLPLLVTIGEAGTWVAGLAWPAVMIAMVRAAGRYLRRTISDSEESPQTPRG